jgi:hypothetical protein
MRDVVSLSGLWMILPGVLSEVHFVQSSIKMKDELFDVTNGIPNERAFRVSMDKRKGVW